MARQQRSSIETARELRGAVSLASDSLNALTLDWKAFNSKNAKTATQHLQVQGNAAYEIKLVAEAQTESYEENIEQCVDLLERLEKAEQLALKIKSLRNTVDRIAHRLDKKTSACLKI